MPPVTLAHRRAGRWYVGTLVEVRGVCSHGATLRALKANAVDAYREMCAADGHALPRPRRCVVEPGTRYVRLTAEPPTPRAAPAARTRSRRWRGLHTAR